MKPFMAGIKKLRVFQKLILSVSALVFILMAVTACQKESVEELVVLTGDISFREPEGIVFHGRITGWGKQEITDHGFLWDTDPTFKNPYKISLGSPQKADFSASPTSVLLKGKTYYFRAFITTKEGTYKGLNQSIFIADRYIAPIIASIDPMMFCWGDTVSIRGKYFSPKINEVKAFVADKDSKIVSTSDSLIKFIVPANLNKVFSHLTLKVAGVQVFSEDTLRLLPPLIQDFFPGEATWNDTITIRGRNFPVTPAQNIVNINSSRATVVKATKEELKVLVPPGLLNNGQNVSVSANAQKTVFTGNLTLKQPIIDNLSPQTDWMGSILEITGNFFHPASNQVFFNNVLGEIVSSSPKKIQVRVPTTLREVENAVTIKIGSQLSAVSSDKFELKLHEVTGFNSNSGSRLLNLEIQGKGFNVSHFNLMTVFFEDKPTNRSSTFSTISAKIPFGHTSGSYPVSVEIMGRKVTAPENFQLYEPFSLIGTIPSAAARPPIVLQYNDRYFIGGDYSFGSKSFFEFIPETNTWIRKNDLPVSAITYATSFSAAGKAFLFNNNNLFEYDPEMDKWIPKAPFPGTNPLVPKGVSTENYGYVVMGGTFEFHRYDPHNDSWLRLKDHPESSGEAFFYDGKVYTIGPAKILRVYNPADNKWEMETSLPGYVYNNGCSVIIHNDILYISGGVRKWDPTDDVFSYDLRSKEIKRITPLPASLSRHFSIIHNQKIYIGGGGTNLYLFDPELLHPSEKS